MHESRSWYSQRMICEVVIDQKGGGMKVCISNYIAERRIVKHEEGPLDLNA